MKAWGILREIGPAGLLDILFMSIIIYAGLVLLKRTKAAFVLRGIFIIGIVYAVARQFNMDLTASVFRDFFAIILIAVIVIFQEELKHFFERIAAWSTLQDFRRKRVLHMARKESEILTRSLRDMAEERIGALIVLRGKDPIHRHLNGGTDLNGELSEDILKSIFDPHSMGHDGAVVIEQGHILQFSCHLPLSKDFKKLGKGGTRHAAALGMAELTDALTLIVSEERGTISAARNGEIEVINDTEQLTLLIEQFFRDTNPGPEARPLQDFIMKNFKEKVLAVVVTFALWFFIVHESKMEYRTFTVPVEITRVDPGVEVLSVSPKDVEVTFLGQRRGFYFLKQNSIKLTVKMFSLRPGKYVRSLTKSNFEYPKDMLFEKADPDMVEVDLDPAGEDKTKP